MQFSKAMFYGRRNAALENQDMEQADWIAPLEPEGSDIEVDDPEDCDIRDPTFTPDDDLDQDEEYEEPSTSRGRQG